MKMVRSVRVAAGLAAVALECAFSVGALAQAQIPADDVALLAMRQRNGEIQRAYYPRDALRRGEEGVVGISVVTDKQGRMRECSVSKSSGFSSLDSATCDFLIEHVAIQSYLSPGGDGGSMRRQEGQIIWKLPAGYTPRAGTRIASAPAAAVANSAIAKKICRVQVKTGSLIASQRICLTKGEWQQQYILAQDQTKDMHPGFQSGK